MDLTLKNSQSNAQYKESVGNDEFKTELINLLRESNYQCQCCGWQTLKGSEENDLSPNYLKWIRKHYTLQVEQNEETNEEVKNVVCISCYSLNHIRQAVENGYVRLVNSVYSQKELIKISWSDATKGKITGTNREKAISSELIIPLQWGNEYYLDIIENEKKNYNKIKAIFTDKFLKIYKYNNES